METSAVSLETGHIGLIKLNESWKKPTWTPFKTLFTPRNLDTGLTKGVYCAPHNVRLALSKSEGASLVVFLLKNSTKTTSTKMDLQSYCCCHHIWSQQQFRCRIYRRTTYLSQFASGAYARYWSKSTGQNDFTENYENSVVFLVLKKYRNFVFLPGNLESRAYLKYFVVQPICLFANGVRLNLVQRPMLLWYRQTFYFSE